MSDFLFACACGCKLSSKLKQIGGDPNCEHDFKPIITSPKVELSTKEHYHQKRIKDILKKTKKNINKFNQEKEELEENFKTFTSTVKDEINDMIEVLETRKQEMLEFGEKQYNSKKEHLESQLNTLRDYKSGCEECLDKMSKIFEENADETPEREKEICQTGDEFEKSKPLPEIYHISNNLEYIIQDETKENLRNDILKYGDIPKNEDPKLDLKFMMNKLSITSNNQSHSHYMDEDNQSTVRSTTSSNEYPQRMNDVNLITTSIINEEEDEVKLNTDILSDKIKNDKREKSPHPSETASTTSITQNQTLTIIMYRWDNKSKKRQVKLKDLNIGWENIKKLIKEKCKYDQNDDFNLIVHKGPDKDKTIKEMQNLLDLQNLEKNYLRIEPI